MPDLLGTIILPGILAIVFGAFLGEIALRLRRTVKYGLSFLAPYETPQPKSFSFQGHPYILYTKVPDSRGLYPANNLGYSGTRFIKPEKEQGSIRIYCIGGSTVEQHSPEDGPNSSWPGLLEDLLSKRFPGTKIECINAGVAGYTSAESLSEFQFRGLDLKPDILLVYHGVNDAWTCQMVDNFQSDYSHVRVQKPWHPGAVHRIPPLPYFVTYQYLTDWLKLKIGKRNALIFNISNPPWVLSREFSEQAARAFLRNTYNLVKIAQAWSCQPIVLRWECDWSDRNYTPPYFIADSREEISRRYFEYVERNNQSLKEICAREENCRYYEVGPFEGSFFSDRMHFTSAGLALMASRVADAIEKDVSAVIQRNAN